MSGTHEPARERDRDLDKPQQAQVGPTRGMQSDDELMALRKAAGAIAEVIEPITTTRKERTN